MLKNYIEALSLLKFKHVTLIFKKEYENQSYLSSSALKPYCTIKYPVLMH